MPAPVEPVPQGAPKTSTLQVIQSVAWSFFGVQSSRNRRRDFTRGNPWHYLVAAALMTGLVVLMIAGAAQLALRYAA